MTSTLTQAPQAPAADAIRQFQFRASDDALADLRRRRRRAYGAQDVRQLALADALVPRRLSWNR